MTLAIFGFTTLPMPPFYSSKASTVAPSVILRRANIPSLRRSRSRPAGSPFSLSTPSPLVTLRCYHDFVQTKQQIRECIWETLQRRGVVRFPGAVGRIPNFDGATQAVVLVRRLQVWHRASVLKCNPDSPQLSLRQAALREGKTVYMAVPRLRQERCFIELDPQRLGRRASAAATIRGAFRYGRQVTVDELRPIDLVVCGSVGVNRSGARIGKSGGYSDLEYALALGAGKLASDTPVLTTVHALQLIDEDIPREVHDIPVDYIVTPQEVIETHTSLPRSEAIYWKLLPPEKLEAIPALRKMAAYLPHLG
jgi:5-formyltetrahydrofolate cyclo-ligase